MDGSSRSAEAIGTSATKAIRIDFARVTPLGNFERSDTKDEPHSSAGLALRAIVGSGRGSVLQGGAVSPLVLLPLRGSVQIADGECSRTVRPRQMLVIEGGQSWQAVGGAAALWIAIVAPSMVWRRLLDAATGMPVIEPVLLTAVHEVGPVIRRAAIRVARDAYAGVANEADVAPSMLAFATLLAEAQSAFDPMIRRCPGRTRAKRRAAFTRLQRVYSWMISSGDLDLDIADFARVASYSTCHFVRTFNAVFGRTPYSVLSEQRLKRAFRLVNDTELSITEVARASGYEDRCAFARSFKRRFGKTATAVRSQTETAIPQSQA